MAQAIRQLPCSPESERALIGACLLNPAIIPQVKAEVQGPDFSSLRHQHIFGALCSLGASTEPLAVAEWLVSHNLLEQCGGTLAVMELAECVSTSAGWRYHVGVIKDKAQRVAIIRACSTAMDAAHGIEESATILSDLKDSIRGIGVQGGKPYRDNAELVNAVWDDIERRSKSGENYVGVKTGFQVIDEKVFGLEPKTTIYLIARPSIGKTALALNIADNMPGRTLFFSLESNAEAITRRRLAAKSKVYLWRIRTANLEDGQYPHLMGAMNTLLDSQVVILEKPAFKVVENLTAQCESMAMDGPISLIVVDHIQRMRSLKRFQNRHLELSWISEELSTLAKNLNVPILILCQLSREMEKRPAKGKYPMLMDMKESGDLEANADQVWSLWREDKETEEARLECLKGRDTGTWVSWLRFDRNVQRFYDAEGGFESRNTEHQESYLDK